METICITLPTFGSAVTVNLDRKKMKTCRLKVYPNQKIVLSLPQSAPDAWAESFLMEKSGWIESKLQSFQKLSAMPQPKRFGTDTLSGCWAKI